MTTIVRLLSPIPLVAALSGAALFAFQDGDWATVSGGAGNLATGDYSSVHGGENNQALGNISSIHGGEANATTHWKSTISGGCQHSSTGPCSQAP